MKGEDIKWDGKQNKEKKRKENDHEHRHPDAHRFTRNIDG